MQYSILTTMEYAKATCHLPRWLVKSFYSEHRRVLPTCRRVSTVHFDKHCKTFLISNFIEAFLFCEECLLKETLEGIQDISAWRDFALRVIILQ